MSLTLASSQYDEVRRAVNPALESAALPDSLIASDVYGGRAARYVLKMVPGADNNAVAVQRAIRYKTAAFLAEMLPEVKSSQLPDQELTFDTYSREKRAALLHRMADDEIVELNANRPSLVLPTFFTLATGRHR